MNLNKVQLIGRVGSDAEMRLTPDGSEITTMRVATNRTWKDQQGEVKEAVEWHSIVAWRQLATQVSRLAKKGRLVYVEGRLETRSWDDRDSGKKMYRTEIVADVVRMLDTKPEDVESSAGNTQFSASDRSTAVVNAALGKTVRENGSMPRKPANDDRFLEFDDTPF